MPNAQNLENVKLLTEKIEASKAIIIVQYEKLAAKTQVKLRAELKKIGAEMSVFKNRLVKLALKNKLGDLSTGLDEALNGPTSVIFGYEDAVATTKALVAFFKDNPSLAAKVGVMMAEGSNPASILTSKDVEALSKLPGKQELLTMLVVRLKSPIQGLHNVLTGNLSGLVRALDAVRKQKEGK